MPTGVEQYVFRFSKSLYFIRALVDARMNNLQLFNKETTFDNSNSSKFSSTPVGILPAFGKLMF
jgi:hypothetical protein